MAVEGISVRHRAFVGKFARLVDAVKPVLAEVANKAFAKFLISENNHSDAENHTVGAQNRASTLLRVILSKIKQNDAYFDTFVAILEEVKIAELAYELKKAVDPTIELSVIEGRNTADSDSGSTAVQHSEATGFRCPCGHCSLESYFRDRSKCRGQDKGPFPYLNLSDLVEDDKTTLTHQLVHETIAIIQEFQTLADGVFEATEAPVNKIIETVFSFGQEGLPKPIQSTHGEELEKIENISQVHIFLTRHKYISFINYRILEKIINKHCEASKDQLGDYLQHFKDFCRRNVFEVPASVLRSSPPSSNQPLVVKVNDDMWFGAKRDCPFTMNDIIAIQTKIAKVIKLDRGYIRLLDVSKGCIQLSFAILSCQEVSIFPLTTSQLSELISLGIIVLYQPKVQLPTNTQASDVQFHDIPTTVSETPCIQSPESECKTSHNIDNTPHISHFTKTGDPSDLESENTSHNTTHISHFTKTGDSSDLESENTSYNSPHISHFIKIGDPSDLESEYTSHNTPPISHYTEAGVPSDLEPEELHKAYSDSSSPHDTIYQCTIQETSPHCVQQLVTGRSLSWTTLSNYEGPRVEKQPFELQLKVEREAHTKENERLKSKIGNMEREFRNRQNNLKEELAVKEKELRAENKETINQLEKFMCRIAMKEKEEYELRAENDKLKQTIIQLEEEYRKEKRANMLAKQLEDEQHKIIIRSKSEQRDEDRSDDIHNYAVDGLQDIHTVAKSLLPAMPTKEEDDLVYEATPNEQEHKTALRPDTLVDLKRLNTIQTSDSSSVEPSPLEMDLTAPTLQDLCFFNSIM